MLINNFIFQIFKDDSDYTTLDLTTMKVKKSKMFHSDINGITFNCADGICTVVHPKDRKVFVGKWENKNFKIKKFFKKKKKEKWINLEKKIKILRWNRNEKNDIC